MSIEDFTKLFTARPLWRLDRLIAPRLLPLAYLAGLLAIGLWAVSHFVASFSLGFMAGIWGLLEIIALGTLAVILLRVVIEAVAIHFAAQTATDVFATDSSPSQSLIEDVEGAISELADESGDNAEPDSAPTEQAKTADQAPKAKTTPARRTRRTAKRSPAKKPAPKSDGGK